MGADKLTGTYKKASTCLDLDGQASTVYNTGDRIFAMPRISNDFTNVRVAARSACGTYSAYTKATRTETPPEPFMCADDGQAPEDKVYAQHVQLKNVTVADGVAKGTVKWVKGDDNMTRPYTVCVVQKRGDVGITQDRTCFMTENGASSAAFGLKLKSTTGVLHAEVRRAYTCEVDYEASEPVVVSPLKSVRWGASLVNSDAVCLLALPKGKLVYGECSDKRVLKTVPVINDYGDYTGVYKTEKNQCVVVKGKTLKLGACPVVKDGYSDAGWMAWKANSYATPEEAGDLYVREFGGNICAPFGKGNVKMGQAPRVKLCTELTLTV